MNRNPRNFLALVSIPLVLSIAGCSNADEDGDAETFADDGKVPAETVKAALESYLSDNEVVGTVESCGEIDDEVDATTTCAATIDDLGDEVTVTVATSNETETTFEFDLTEFGYTAE